MALIFWTIRLESPLIRRNMRAMEFKEVEGARSSPVRVVLLEGHGLLRTSLCHVLASQPDIELVGDCSSGEEALKLLRELPVDLAIVPAVGLDDGFGFDFIPAAQAAGYRGKFLVMAESADARSSAAALRLGASGIFLKSEPAGRLVQAVRNISDGGVWIDHQVIQLLADRVSMEDHAKSNAGLTQREEKVLQGIVDGLSNRKIGQEIGLKEGSVKAIVQQLFGKTGVRTRAKLVRLAMERSLAAATPSAK
jgi:DNA-binding NarL/FixJ family response regulator